MFAAERNEILVVDDDKTTADLIASFFDPQEFHVTIATSTKQAISLLKERYFKIILADVDLGDSSGLVLIPYTKRIDKPSIIIFVTGHGSLESAVKALDAGVFDYVGKSDDVASMKTEIIHRVRRALQQLEPVNHHEHEENSRVVFSSRTIIGESPLMVSLYQMIAKSARSNSNVLVLGESGTGKELVAKAIHDNGPKANNPFVTVNCSALTETLLESELFGHVKGSFTGAVSNKKGLFEEADGGTLFLDEIGDVPLSVQVKLLRAIQEGEIKPVGALENRIVQVRIIAATHRDLEAQVKNGTFREDLYYRLKVFQLEVPALRNRKQDIPELAQYFISKLQSNGGPRAESISDEALSLLQSYPWPGNVRELENAIERAAGMTNSHVLYPDDFPPEIVACTPKEESAVETTPANANGKSLEEIEIDHITRTLDYTHYNKSKAAQVLKIDRGTLYRKAIEYGIPLTSPHKENGHIDEHSTMHSNKVPRFIGQISEK